MVKLFVGGFPLTISEMELVKLFQFANRELKIKYCDVMFILPPHSPK
jgi:hypothetical protein